MPRSGRRTVRTYSDEFKLTAVRLSQQPGLQVKTAAAAPEIHPFMLSKWKDGRRSYMERAAKAAPAPARRRVSEQRDRRRDEPEDG
jgi:transposase